MQCEINSVIVMSIKESRVKEMQQRAMGSTQTRATDFQP